MADSITVCHLQQQLRNTERFRQNSEMQSAGAGAAQGVSKWRRLNCLLKPRTLQLR